MWGILQTKSVVILEARVSMRSPDEMDVVEVENDTFEEEPGALERRKFIAIAVEVSARS